MVCVGQPPSEFGWFVLVRLLRWLDGLLWLASVGGSMVRVGQPLSVVRRSCWSASFGGLMVCVGQPSSEV